MKKNLSIIFLLCANYVLAQDTISVTKPAAEHDPIFTIVENMPQFPGGDEGLFKFLRENIEYPKAARRKGIQGKVYVAFVVDKEGAVQDVHLARGASPQLDEEAIRVVKLMPRWTPGLQDGKPVSVTYNLPIYFSLK